MSALPTPLDKLVEDFLREFQSNVRVKIAGSVTESVSVYDILRPMRISDSTVRRYISSRNTAHFSRDTPTQRVGNSAKNFAAHKTVMVNDVGAVRDLVTYSLRVCQKSAGEKSKIAAVFGIDADVIGSAFVGMPEQDSLDMLERALPESWHMERQFRVGRYRVDAYFPLQRVAVCCDERGHSAYDSREEEERERFIRRTLLCAIVRFDPIVDDPSDGEHFFSLMRAVLSAHDHVRDRVEDKLDDIVDNLVTFRLYEEESEEEEEDDVEKLGERLAKI